MGYSMEYPTPPLHKGYVVMYLLKHLINTFTPTEFEGVDKTPVEFINKSCARNTQYDVDLTKEGKFKQKSTF